MKRCILVVFLALTILPVASCSQGKESDIIPDLAVHTDITVSATPTSVPYPDQVVIANGDVTFNVIYDDYYVVDGLHQNSVSLIYNYLPRDVNIVTEEWTSSDESVAKVNERGVVSPVGIGTCEIKLHVTDGLTDGAYTTTTIEVENDVTIFDENEYPSYRSIFEYFENNLKYEADYYYWDLDDNYIDVDTGFAYSKQSLFVFCGNTDSSKYRGISPREFLLDNRFLSQKFYIGEMDGMTLIVYDNNESSCINIFCDEYEISILDSNKDCSSAVQLMKELGFPDISEYFDLEALR